MNFTFQFSKIFSKRAAFSLFVLCGISMLLGGNQTMALSAGLTMKTKAGVPTVYLTGSHAKQCVARIGQKLVIPKLPTLAGESQDLVSLAGKNGTVVVFLKTGNMMTEMLLQDLSSAVIQDYKTKGFNVVIVAVQEPAGRIQQLLGKAGISVPTLLDSTNKAFATVGSMLPSLYVLNSQGAIEWFDIEYSLATRRELTQTIKVLSSPNAKPKR